MKPMFDYQSASAIMKKAVYSVKRSQAGREAAQTVLEKHGSRKNRGRRTLPNDRQRSLFEESAE
jgi:hypothetical protein